MWGSLPLYTCLPKEAQDSLLIKTEPPEAGVLIRFDVRHKSSLLRLRLAFNTTPRCSLARKYIHTQPTLSPGYKAIGCGRCTLDSQNRRRRLLGCHIGRQWVFTLTCCALMPTSIRNTSTEPLFRVEARGVRLRDTANEANYDHTLAHMIQIGKEQGRLPVTATGAVEGGAAYSTVSETCKTNEAFARHQRTRSARILET